MAQAYIYWVQSETMKKGLEETRGAVAAARESAEASKAALASSTEQTIIVKEQLKTMQASITEASRTSKAMERISDSMAQSVQSVETSVGINREIADRQKLITELQSRAYVTILFDGMVPQNPDTNIRFEPMFRILNQGNTPAYNIGFAIVADVLPFPLRDDVAFALPAAMRHSSFIASGQHKIISAVVPKLYPEPEARQIRIGVGQRIVTWGIVNYEDAFGIKRFVKFAFSHYLVGDNNWMSMDDRRHNESN